MYNRNFIAQSSLMHPKQVAHSKPHLATKGRPECSKAVKVKQNTAVAKSITLKRFGQVRNVFQRP